MSKGLKDRLIPEHIKPNGGCEIMTKQKYVGVGTSLDDATKNLYEVAQKNGVVGNPAEVEYTCRVKVGRNYVSGQPNTDYEKAFTSALEEAKVKDAKKLEVFAAGTYAAVEQAKPKAAGAAASSRASESLTDLF